MAALVVLLSACAVGTNSVTSSTTASPITPPLAVTTEEVDGVGDLPPPIPTSIPDRRARDVAATVELFDEGIYVTPETSHSSCYAVLNAGLLEGYSTWIQELRAGERSTLYFSDFRESGEVVGEAFDPVAAPVETLSLHCDGGKSYSFWSFTTLTP